MRDPFHVASTHVSIQLIQISSVRYSMLVSFPYVLSFSLDIFSLWLSCFKLTEIFTSFGE